MRISRRRLSKKVLIKIYQLFFKVISRFDDQKGFYGILDDIFYPTEKIMIAKRVAIIYLILKNIPQDRIAEVLKVSTGTVSRFSILIHKKKTKMINLLRQMIKKEKVINFFEDTLADFFIQPGLQKGYWHLYWEQKRRQRKRETYGI